MTMSFSFVGKVTCATILLLLCAHSSFALRRRIQSVSLNNHYHHSPHVLKQQQVNQSLTINLYYESLCPDCVDFIGNKLCPLWEQSLMSNYFGIEFVPYGNAETIISKTGEITFECQHGPEECAANFIHACALKHLSYKESVKFICCVERSHNAPGSGANCAEELSIDYAPINTCANCKGNGCEGVQLHYRLGKQTDSLKPEHEYVPWTLFNGVYNQKDMDQSQTDLLGVVCKYIKDPKPTECNEVY